MTYRQFIKFLRAQKFIYKGYVSFQELSDANGIPYFQLLFNVRIYLRGQRNVFYYKQTETLYKAYNRSQLKGVLSEQKKLLFIQKQLSEITTFIIEQI